MKALRIDVRPAYLPANLMHNQEEFLYIRTGQATTPLRVSEVYAFLYTRFFQKLIRK